MRGLPYSAKEKEITDFFAPLTINHLDIDIDNYGRPSGEALVYFNSHEDATAAMQKNKNNIGTYIVCADVVRRCIMFYTGMYVCIQSCTVEHSE